MRCQQHGSQVWLKSGGRLGLNGTNPGLFQIRFQYILALPPKVSEIGPKWEKSVSFFRLDFSTFCYPIWGQSANLTHFGDTA